MIVRPALADDAAALAEVVRRAITVTGATVYDADQIGQWSASFSAEALEHIVASTAVFVVERDGAIAGLASLVVDETGRAEVDLLYVDPDFSGHGVARRALAAVEQEARHAGVSTLWADASLLAAPVFEHLGYTVVERYNKVRGAVTFPNTWLAKDLA